MLTKIYIKETYHERAQFSNTFKIELKYLFNIKCKKYKGLKNLLFETI
jgi:hypothetical protein